MKLFNVLAASTFIFAIGGAAGSAAQDVQPDYLQDRGEGLPTSMFGTYIRHRELITYFFFEYYLDNDMEYKPSDFGYGLEEDFRGRYRALEGLVYVGYGLADWAAIEIEAAVIKASLEKSPEDTSALPQKIEESGLGDVEAQFRWRWFRENERRPELFSYFETVFPFQQDKTLIGTQNWEFKLGTGVIKGFDIGTFTLRAAVDYVPQESKVELGEYALEYLKRLSPAWRAYAGFEGSQDELSFIAEVQWHVVTDKILVKINSSFGVTSKATDWAPEVGVLFYW